MAGYEPFQVPTKMSNIIDAMNKLLAETAKTRGHINVISGPTRNPCPAIFYVVTACLKSIDTKNLRSCPIDQQKLQAFILPVQQWTEKQACISYRDWIAFHVATLLNVERATDLHFFPDLPLAEKLNLLSRTTIDSTLVIDPTRK